MRKRSILTVLALWMVLAALPVNAGAAGTNGQWGGLDWSYDESSHKLTISGQGDMPATYPDFGDYMSEIQEIEIGSEVTSVSVGAFQRYQELTAVTFLGDGIEIQDSAFEGCGKLETVSFAGGVGKIGGKAFYECIALQELSFPGRVGEIGDSAFEGCKNLETVTFSGDVGNIGDSAFCDCVALKELVFPDTVTVSVIGNYAFSGSSLTRVQLPYGVTLIGDGAFSPCANLTAVAIPKSVGTVYRGSFLNCPVLMDIFFGGDEIEWKAADGDEVTGLFIFGFQNVNRTAVLHTDDGELPELCEAKDPSDLLNLFQSGAEKKRADVVLDGNINLDRTWEIPAGWNVVLDLNGNTLTSTVDPVAIEMKGNSLLILDSTASGTPGVGPDHETVTYVSGEIHSAHDAVYVQPGCVFVLQGGRIQAGEDGAGVTVYANRNPFQNGRDTREDMPTGLLIQGGYVDAGNSAVVAHGKTAEARVRGGVLRSWNASAVSGGENQEEGDTRIYIWNAILIGKTSGMYHPQSGYAYISDTDIYAKNGDGVLMRGGNLDMSGSMNLDAVNRIVIDQQADLYDADAIRVTLDKNLLADPANRPLARLKTGYTLVTPESTGGTEYYLIYGEPSVTFNFNYLNGPGNKTVTTEGGTVPQSQWPADPARPGYRFLGWSEHENGLGSYVAKNKVFLETQTLYAQWIPEGAYVVSFWLYEETRIFKATGSDGVLTDWPVADPYLGGPFAGWYTARGNAGTEYAFDHVFTADTEVYAHYGDPAGPGGPHNITFYPNNNGISPPIVKPTGADGILPAGDWPDAPVFEGYCFQGWSWSASHDIMPGTDYVFYKDSSLFARWIPNTGYTVVFYPNNGEAAVTRQTNEHGRLEQWPDTPRLTNYTFGGWYRWQGSGFMDASEKFTADTALFAYWVRNGGVIDPNNPKAFQITFNPAGGTLGPDTGSRAVTASDGTLTVLPQPTRTGYTFLGWYTAETGGDLVTENTVFSAHSTLYARWSDGSTAAQTTYTITFDPNGGKFAGGSNPTAKTGANGKLSETDLSNVPAPTHDTLDFEAWYTARQDGYKVDATYVFRQDTTVYAHWKERTGGGSGSGGDTGSGDSGSGGSGSGTGTGSGAGTETTAYAIRLASGIRHGTISPSHTSAEAGTWITLTVTPDADYVVDWVGAERENGQSLSLSRSGKRYSFTMPASDVTVDASFSLLAPYNTFIPPQTQPQAQAAAQAALPASAFTPVTWRPAVAMRDVPAGSWAYTAAQWAYQNGYLDTASDGTFRLNDTVSHIQLWRIMARWLGEPAWDDSSVSQWARRSGAAKAGNASSAMTRQNMVEYLYQCYFLMGGDVSATGNLLQYRDSQQITSTSARNAWIWAVEKGIIAGTPDGSLNPGGILSRGEFAVILMRLCQS